MKINRYIIYISLLLGINLFFAGTAFCKDYSKGEAIYRHQCTQCHLIKSEGAPMSAYYREFQPKDFTTSPASQNLSEKKIKSVLTEGKGNMRPVKLSEEDYKALVDYMINDLKKRNK